MNLSWFPYPRPELRTAGDIDIWVDIQREEAISFLKKKGFKVGNVFIHHIDVDVFSVEESQGALIFDYTNNQTYINNKFK